MIQSILDFFVKIAPLLAALGLFHIAAAGVRGMWNNVKAKAAITPNKVDDFLVHIADPPLEAAIALLDAGDIAGAKAKIAAVRALVGAK